MRSSKSSKTSKLQKLLNKKRDLIESILFKMEVDFIIESFQCEEESGEYEVTAYVVCTEGVDGAILPDMGKGTVAFLVYNQNLADHMREEGFTDEEIEKNGKVWTIIENAETFVKILTS